jgi:hypothetical protein
MTALAAEVQLPLIQANVTTESMLFRLPKRGDFGPRGLEKRTSVAKAVFRLAFAARLKPCPS